MGNNSNAMNPLNMSEMTRDAFRTLRMNINFSGGDKNIQTLMVTSALPNDGKTSISVGLGVSMAESIKNTLIIECDCRRPSVGNRLKLRPDANWVDVIYGNATLEDAVTKTECPNLYFLDAEPGLVHSVELLNSGRFWEMIEEVKGSFDFIIFDTPPLGSVIDAAVIAEHTDGSILVLNSGTKDIRLLKETAEQLKKAKARILGVVINRVSFHQSGYYRYRNYYSNQKQNDSADPKSEKKKKDKKSQTFDRVMNTPQNTARKETNDIVCCGDKSYTCATHMKTAWKNKKTFDVCPPKQIMSAVCKGFGEQSAFQEI